MAALPERGQHRKPCGEERRRASVRRCRRERSATPRERLADGDEDARSAYTERLELGVSYASSVSAEADEHAVAAKRLQEALAPLDQHHRVVPDAIDEAELEQLVDGAQPIEIGVNERDPRGQLVHQRERRRGHGDVRLDAERARDGSHQERLARAEAALEHDQIAGRERTTQRRTEPTRRAARRQRHAKVGSRSVHRPRFYAGALNMRGKMRRVQRSSTRAVDAASLRCALALAALVSCATRGTAAQDRLAHDAAVVAPPAPTPTRYVIEASLDPTTHIVDGTLRLHWVNESAAPAVDLWLHLYLNAFANNDTVFMRESRGQLRGVRNPGRGRIEVTSLRTEAGVDLLPHARTDLIRGDATQMRVVLPSPVATGDAIDLRIVFRSHLPPVFARSGYVRDFHMIAQWFPKLAAREPSGAWSSFPYHGMGEFYSDFATYELALSVPTGWIVGATGEQTSEEARDGRVVRHFRADRVHDAAWVAWPHFRERAVTHEGVQIRILYPPGHDAAVPRHEHAVREGLTRLGRAFGPYPYRTLTVVLPPRGADGAAGMEYPTLIVSAGPWMDLPGIHTPVPEDVTVHELAHEWFYGLVASNEVAWPMLDEGLTQWATSRVLADLYGESRSAVSLPGLTLSNFELQRLFALRGRPVPAPGLPAYAFDDTGYGRSVYLRTALVLETTRRSYGAARFDRALGHYARAQRFRHPTPDDLFASFDGVFGGGFSDRVLRPALMRGETADARLVRLSSVRNSAGAYLTEIEAQREGTLALPLWIELRGEHGERRRLPWAPGVPRYRASFTARTQFTAALLDPDRHNLLDANALDGTIAHRTAPSRAVLSRVVALFHAMIAAVGA